jgi:hypothetical protein
MRHSPGTMKLPLCLFLALASLLPAQDQPKDPFVKDKQAAGAAAVPGEESIGRSFSSKPAAGGVPKNILCLVETFTLPQADYAALLDAPGGRDKLHEHVLAAVKTGSAKLDGCHLITTQSGLRCSLESTDELIYPTEWTAADRTGFQYPTAFESRQLGDRFEFEPTLDVQSGAIGVTHSFSRDRFLGFRLYKADATLAGVPVMDLFERQGPSGCSVIPGVPALLSTLNDAQQGAITLVFATLQVVTVAAPAPPAAKSTGNLILTERLISLDRMKGWELLMKHGKDGAACLAELKPLLASKEAVLEQIFTVCTRSGIRAAHASGLLHAYGTEFSPPSEGAPAQPSTDPKKPGTPSRAAGLAGTTAFENRNLGFRLEVEPIHNPENAYVDVTLAPEYVHTTGPLKDKNWSEHYPEVPLFSIQTVTTGYTQVIGTTTLISTLNPPGDTGANEHKDEGRIWLLFMDVNLE